FAGTEAGPVVMVVEYLQRPRVAMSDAVTDEQVVHFKVINRATATAGLQQQGERSVLVGRDGRDRIHHDTECVSHVGRPWVDIYAYMVAHGPGWKEEKRWWVERERRSREGGLGICGWKECSRIDANGRLRLAPCVSRRGVRQSCRSRPAGDRQRNFSR